MKPVAVSLGQRRAVLGALALLLAIPPFLARAADPRFGEIIVSDEKDAGESDDSFEPDTAKIFLAAQLIDVPQGARVASSWVSVSTKVAPPNYVIDTAEITVTGRANVANFSLSKPNTGWPVGSYRVDLTINGRKAASTAFKVKS
ncbi:MAG: hypothetical protein JWQ33_1661 [Ramlibacter sp.]|nr:hypothetical protein [Ramlibacter sp.]